MKIYENNVSTNENQMTANNAIELTSLINNIKFQLGNIRRENNETDYFKHFIIDYLGLDDDNLENGEYFTHDKLTEYDKEYIDDFSNKINDVFQDTIGISFTDGDLYLYHCLYKVFVTNLTDYFCNYVCGLQKLDEDFVEDIPNYQEYKFDYFCKNYYNTDIKDLIDKPEKKYILVREYLMYLLHENILVQNYFQVCLLESEGNVELSALFIESENGRMVYDNDFFLYKIEKVCSFFPIFEEILNKLHSLI